MKTLKKIAPILGYGLVIGALIFIIIQNRNRGQEIQRLRMNDENMVRQMQDDKEDLIQFTLSGKNELEDLLTAQQKVDGSIIKDLKYKIEEQGLKLNRIDRIVMTQISARDTTYNEIVLDSIGKLLEWLKTSQNDSIVIPFEDKSTCFEFKARLKFKDGTTSVEVVDRQYNDTITHISTWERKQWKLLGIIPTRFLGRKISTVEIFNNCGYSKTFVIDNTRANRKRKKR